jgi:hypothetical protein
MAINLKTKYIVSKWLRKFKIKKYELIGNQWSQKTR